MRIGVVSNRIENFALACFALGAALVISSAILWSFAYVEVEKAEGKETEHDQPVKTPATCDVYFGKNKHRPADWEYHDKSIDGVGIPEKWKEHLDNGGAICLREGPSSVGPWELWMSLTALGTLLVFIWVALFGHKHKQEEDRFHKRDVP